MIMLRRVTVLHATSKKYSTKTHIINSNVKSIKIPQIGLPEFLWSRQHKWSTKTAIVCAESGRSYTYHDLYKKSLSFSKFIKDNLKLNEQDTVGIVLGNVPEYPIALLGAIQAGLKVTTCNPNYTAEEIKNQLVNCETRVVVTSKDNLPQVRQACGRLPIIEIPNNKVGATSTDCINFNEITSSDANIPSFDINFNDTIVMPYSSGTTGLPKGVELSHSNLVSNLCQATSSEFQVIHQSEDKQDVVLAFLPFFHIYGLVVLMLQALAQGAKLVAMPEFTSDGFNNVLRKHKPDVLYSTPPIMLMMINNSKITSHDLLCLRTIMSGAAPLAASDIDRFNAKTSNRVDLIQGYGMTETSPITILQTKNLPHGIKTGGIGFLVPNTQARIVPIGAENSSNLPPNQSGELVVKGPQVMKGYYRNASNSNDVFLEEGWLKTGDVAYYDEHGHFYITDRLKELIKVKGFQVAPAELEGILRDHPGVEDAAVAGVSHDLFGEAPKAFIVRKKGANVQQDTIKQYVAAKVAKHKCLEGGVVFVDAIPKNPSGKILRRELKKM